VGVAAARRRGEEVVELERVPAEVVVLALLLGNADVAVLGCAVVLDIDSVRGADALVVAGAEVGRAHARHLEFEQDAAMLRPAAAVGSDRFQYRAPIEGAAVPGA
jgi:hypothetical protein